MNLPIKKLNENAILPTYGSADAAGMDLYALLDEPEITIAPGETKFVHTGIAVAIPTGYVGLLFARSGLACKKGLAPANKVGVIDADYRGEIMVALHNHNEANSSAITISNKERIAQLSIIPFIQPTLKEVDDLDNTVRGEGGFGSTGTN